MDWGIMLVIICLVAIQTEAYGESGNREFFLSNVDSDFFLRPRYRFKVATGDRKGFVERSLQDERSIEVQGIHGE